MHKIHTKNWKNLIWYLYKKKTKLVYFNYINFMALISWLLHRVVSWLTLWCEIHPSRKQHYKLIWTCITYLGLLLLLLLFGFFFVSFLFAHGFGSSCGFFSLLIFVVVGGKCFFACFLKLNNISWYRPIWISIPHKQCKLWKWQSTEFLCTISIQYNS